MLQLSDIQDVNLGRIKDHLCIVAAAHPMSEIAEEMQFLSQGFNACDLLSVARFRHLRVSQEPAAQRPRPAVLSSQESGAVV